MRPNSPSNKKNQMPSNFGMTEIIETVRFYEEDENECEI